jgi:hypothetical protein
VVGSCEQGNELFVSLKGTDFLDQLNNYQLLKKDSATILSLGRPVIFWIPLQYMILGPPTPSIIANCSYPSLPPLLYICLKCNTPL